MATLADVAVEEESARVQQELEVLFHQLCMLFGLLIMLLLTESTLYWLNRIWTPRAPNQRALLLGHINNWMNEVEDDGDGTPPNMLTSNSLTSGTADPPSSTVPSAMTKATTVSSATSGVAAAGKVTQHAAHPINQEESNNDFNKPISEFIQTGSKHKHSSCDDSQYVATSEVDEADNEESDTGYNDTDICLTQTAKRPRVTAMDLMNKLKTIITTVVPRFKDLTDIHPGTPAFILASQQLSVWRSNYGSTVIAIIAHFLSLEYKPVKGEIKDMDEMEDVDVPGKDMDERRSPQEICGDFMTGLAFLFKDLEAKPENVF
ncbi:hypothetical protein SCLCIDRAFT_26361 [Scleroderma citrinum Foug A]|uniref:Uncharacterized protein n=1 Tax=Scleroderma citrinum Foug A TaxID=1036808 RepID=A0A0C2ZGR5_9AGAM|nr:hypothetical protein SCLCIDRAFT_26361 [Scleroderma citrinum Foug A]